MVEGRYCQFDGSRRPARQAFITSVVEYADRKIPELFDALEMPVPFQKVRIQFSPNPGGWFTRPNSLYLYDNHLDNDLGCVIHECVHWAQQADDAVYRARIKIFEGVADYYRIVLSDDKQGDYFDSSKSTLVPVFDTSDLYNSGSEFIAYLRRISGNPNFVRDLNSTLCTNCTTKIDDFFLLRFSRDFDRLHADYPSQRDGILGGQPQSISRYQYFTAAP